MIQLLLKSIVIGCSVFMLGAMTDSVLHTQIIIKDAEARVYRIQPVKPKPAAVAVRTSRRVIHRTHVYVATLPPGCTTVIIEGTSLHHCGTTYYQVYDSKYVVVVID